MSSCVLRRIVASVGIWRTGGDVFLFVYKYSCVRRDVEDRGDVFLCYEKYSCTRNDMEDMRGCLPVC